MDMTRIKDMQNYQGENEGFISLNAAIWKRAVEDEFKKAKHILFGYIKYDVYKIKGKRINKKLIQKGIDVLSPSVLTTVRNNIYNESLKWPQNSQCRYDYSHHKTELLKLIKQWMGVTG